MARKSLTKKTRFEVFKRDSFTCQYCGRMAPDVILEVDHINPVANGGDNEIINLITSCYDCNRGKGKRTLSDKDEIKKQQEQLKELNSKREQLQMMLEWRNELLKFEDEQVSPVEEIFKDNTGKKLTQRGKDLVKRWNKEFGLQEILECTEISFEQYYDGWETEEKTFEYIPRIASTRRRQKDNPSLAKKNYIRAIFRNRDMLFNEKRLNRLLNEICTDEIGFSELKDMAMSCRNWTHFWELVNEMYEGEF